MLRLFSLSLATVLAGAASGCDFTPTLDVPLPEFEPALTINGVLAADSTVEIQVTATLDPYVAPNGYSYTEGGVMGFRGGTFFPVPEGVTATLARDGVSLGPLTLDVRRCPLGSGSTTYPCGFLVSEAVVEAGRTYTVRAEAPGYPPAEATVTVPARIPATAATARPRPNGSWADVDLNVTLRDPSGPGDRYALMVVSGPYSYPDRSACYRDAADTVCPDSTLPLIYSNRERIEFTTSDPVLVAGSRAPTANLRFVTFTDDVFDGTERTFQVRPKPSGDRTPIAVWVIAVDDRTFGAYQIAWLGDQTGDNPLSDPVNLPSNVVGGYGLLGAVAITEAMLD